MPHISFSPVALRDLERLREFLRPKNAAAAKRTGQVIVKAIQLLAQYPLAGRPAEELGENLRALTIGFGDTGYVALYRYDDDIVTILAVRHQKETAA